MDILNNDRGGEKMKNYVGKQVMVIASFIKWIGIIASILVGLFLLLDYPIYGIIIASVGSIAFWFLAFIIYAFGQLVDDVSAIRKSITDNNER